METRILDVAQNLIETRGYNAFSYRDIAEEVGIKTASIHYYFPHKVDLVLTLVRRYGERLDGMLSEINTGTSGGRNKLSAFLKLVDETLCAGNRMCLCGMLASEVSTLEPGIKAELLIVFEKVEKWVIAFLEEGISAGEFRKGHDTASLASMLLGCFEGILLFSRLSPEKLLYNKHTQQLISLL